ncbi:hypothetical protein OA57_10970 [Chelonobacter oris]|uniref:TRAP transporter small permease protein n=1 Tax=Chelonobacter oris TaxID=505317 RepID=A0A0A3AR05_9PAST|nr:TRAP transporter small permease [Chelonobacter oris]KGQ69530.1 hypothetical protein OA57_10970 [Chelonobacter oris]
MLNFINKLISNILILMMILLTFCVIWQVISRYILSAPSTITEELSRFLMIWICLLGASYAVGQKRHLSIDLLNSFISDINQSRLQFIINIIILIFSLLLTWGGIFLVRNVLLSEQVSPALRIPMGYIYIILPASSILIVYYIIIDIYKGFLYGK